MAAVTKSKRKTKDVQRRAISSVKLKDWNEKKQKHKLNQTKSTK